MVLSPWRKGVSSWKLFWIMDHIHLRRKYMAIGPLELIMIGCPGKRFASEVLPELSAIQEQGLIEVVCGLPASLSSMDRLWVNDRPDNLWIKTAKWSIDLISCL